MINFISFYQKLERFFGQVKFAVVIISVFAIYLAFGTFMESYHGTDYANRLVYKSYPFMLVQALMFISIVCATTLRFPIKKHLHGFYVIHLGLVILFIGSFITYKAGVDGSITLPPNAPNRQVQLSQDELKLTFRKDQKEVSVELPYASGEKDLKLEWQNVKVKRFFPFAENKLTWVDFKPSDVDRSHSSVYQIKNDNFSEEFTLSLHPDSDFKSTSELGPLSVHYMPGSLGKCFAENNSHRLIIFDAEKGDCFAPKENEISKGKQGLVLSLNRDGQNIRFLPQFSPLPVDKEMKIVDDSRFRVFDRKLFQDKPHLFTFGESVAFYDKSIDKWQEEKFGTDHKPISLPWMGFELTLLKHESAQYPKMIPESVKPVQDNGKIIIGNLKALEMEIEGQTFWVTSDAPLTFNSEKGPIDIELTKKNLRLPFELTLDRFHMEKDPGTNNPASYESFVSVFRGDAGSEKHHVFMNHPMKLNAFTFYQASYFENQGIFSTILSVNYDPGRPWKYLGSLLIVLGSAYHFVLRRKRTPVGEMI